MYYKLWLDVPDEGPGVDERLTKRAWKAILHAMFPMSQGFVVLAEQSATGRAGDRTAVDGSVTFTIFRDNHTLLVLELKSGSHLLSRQQRDSADRQIRDRIHTIMRDRAAREFAPLFSKVFIISSIGMRVLTFL